MYRPPPSFFLCALCAAMLCCAAIRCKDVSTTSDPKQTFVNTTVTLTVSLSPVNASAMMPGDVADITVTVHDTNHYSNVVVLSCIISGVNASDFLDIDSEKFPLAINAMDSAAFRIRFTPQKIGAVTAMLALKPDSNNIGVIDTLQYFVGVGTLSLSDTTINFGFVQTDSTGSQSILITNTGQSPVRIHNVYYAGGDSGSFGYHINPTMPPPFTMPPSGTFTLQLQFNPYSQGAHSTSLIIAADSLPAVFIYLTGIGANNGMALQPDPILFAYHSAAQAQTVAFDTLYDFNLNNSYQYVDSIIIVPQVAADSSLFALSGTFPVTVPPPSGPNPANGVVAQIAIIRFNGVPQVAPHYGYLEVYFREAPGAPILVPLVAGPF